MIAAPERLMLPIGMFAKPGTAAEMDGTTETYIRSDIAEGWREAGWEDSAGPLRSLRGGRLQHGSQRHASKRAEAVIAAYAEAVAIVERCAALGLEWEVSPWSGRIQTKPDMRCTLEAVGAIPFLPGRVPSAAERTVMAANDNWTGVRPGIVDIAALRALMLRRLVEGRPA